MRIFKLCVIACAMVGLGACCSLQTARDDSAGKHLKRPLQSSIQICDCFPTVNINLENEKFAAAGPLAGSFCRVVLKQLSISGRDNGWGSLVRGKLTITGDVQCEGTAAKDDPPSYYFGSLPGEFVVEVVRDRIRTDFLDAGAGSRYNNSYGFCLDITGAFDEVVWEAKPRADGYLYGRISLNIKIGDAVFSYTHPTLDGEGEVIDVTDKKISKYEGRKSITVLSLAVRKREMTL